MKETGIIMSGDHPKLILERLKTMTRRTWGLERVNTCPDDWEFIGTDGILWRFQNKHDGTSVFCKCPYGQVGDRLWVRETWCVDYMDSWKPSELPDDVRIWYLVGGDKPLWAGKIRHSLFLPRRFSRILLEITEIRAERLSEITSSDVTAEGIDNLVTFMLLWDRLNKKRGYEWKSNCWVWVITFKLCQ